MAELIQSLSKKPHTLAASYDVIVVGSGYGGAVAAARLAGARKSNGALLRIALLERGREHRPGEFPDTAVAALEEFQVSLEGKRLGRNDGLYEFHAGADISVLKGCGLGGTSLINASVSLEPDARVFEDPVWPDELRADRQIGLGRAFDRARAMLRPEPYPGSSAKPAKLAALEMMAERMGEPCERPPVNVHFGPAGPNHVGVTQQPCTGCGDCVSGCNVGAKNTLLMNYLPYAAAKGAELFTCIRSTRIERRDGGGWRVYFLRSDIDQVLFDAPEQYVEAEVVVLAAGSLGSTEILLRSRSALPLSEALGSRFTGNGDIVAFGFDLSQRINGIGCGTERVNADDPVGPCITGLIDLRKPERPLEEGFVIEEGSIPGALAPYMASFLQASKFLEGRSPQETGASATAHFAHTTESFLLGPRHGAVNHTQTFLVMGQDGEGGRIRLEEDQPRIDWPGVGTSRSIGRPNQVLKEATRDLGGIYVRDPIWTSALGDRLVTVHPLGGCPIGRDVLTGVVDHKGRVFRADVSGEVYADLLVCDGSVIPRSLGVNPLLTITALAERNIALLAADQGWTLDEEAPRVQTPLANTRTPVGIRFTESMSGSVTLTKSEAVSDCRFVLTIESDDVDAFVRQPGQTARLSGSVTVRALSSEAMQVMEGEFALFVTEPSVVETKIMRYRLRLRAKDGCEYRFLGQKFLRDHGGLTAWSDTTTLFVEIRRDPSEDLLARGVLRIPAQDLLKQLLTMRAVGATSTQQRLRAFETFGRYFAGTLFDTYGGIAARYPFLGAEPTNDGSARKIRPLRAPLPTIHLFTTDDGKVLRLTRYRGGARGPVLLIHGLGVSSRIFSIDTIDTNLVEALCVQEYDVWLLDYRASIALALSNGSFSGDEIARFDHPAAVAEVLRRTGATAVQVVAHCFGANTLFMAMMRGLKGIRSVVFSQVAGHLIAPFANELRAGLHLPGFLEKMGIRSLSASVSRSPNWHERLFDISAALNPTVLFGEHCASPCCHRISFLYAPLFEHHNLNEATHEALEEMFGVANIEVFEHLSLMVRRSKIVEKDGSDSYLPNHVDQLAKNLAYADMGILLLQGELNQCYRPEGTLADLTLLQSVGDPARVQRKLIAGYGHIDCIFGKDAAIDVYPHILEHLNRYRNE